MRISSLSWMTGLVLLSILVWTLPVWALQVSTVQVRQRVIAPEGAGKSASVDDKDPDAVPAAQAPAKSKKSKKSSAAQVSAKPKKSKNESAAQAPAKSKKLKKSAASQASAKPKKSKKLSAAQAPAKSKKSKKTSVVPAPQVSAKSNKSGKVHAVPVKSKKTHDVSSAASLHLNVKSALLMNMSTGSVYYEQNADRSIPPASITKLLTLYLIREAVANGRLNMSTPIPVSERAAHTGGSYMYLQKGDQVPLREMIKGISVVSANNACVAVAEYMSHGRPWEFVSRMNAKADRLGMTGSTFKNPNGLPASGQLTTARDVAKLSAAYLRAFPESLTIHSMTRHTYHGVTKRNANSLLGRYQGADGLKTGFVCASGFNITATAKRGRTRLLAVVMGAQSSKIREIETRKLLDYGFRKAALEASGQDVTRGKTRDS